MNLLIYFCSLIGICQGNFDLELTKALSFESDFVVNEQYVNKGKIKDPPGTWINLLYSKDYCLFYKTVYKERLGNLKLVKNELGKCSEVAASKFQITDLNSLEFKFTQGKRIEIKYEVSGLIKNSIVELLNYKEKRDFKKYDSNLDSLYFKNITIGQAPSRANLMNGQLCHGVNSNCVSVVENGCDTCESGFYEVVDYNCPQGGSKYCGINECGQKDKPACPRGYEILETKLSSLCFDGSPAGYCAPGLKTFCNEDKILVCL